VSRSGWERLWLYFRAGPPAEIAQSVVDLLRPEETFRDTPGPWKQTVIVNREEDLGEARPSQTSSSKGRFSKRRSRSRDTPHVTDEISAARRRRQVIGVSLGVAATIWWFWPWMRPPVPPVLSAQDGPPLVVGVDGSSFRRIKTALSAWRAMPGARLLVMDLGAIQSTAELRNAAFTPEEIKRVTVIRTCGDTLTMAADWVKYMQQMPGGPGQLLVVTSPDHMERLTAILQVMLGGDGWRLEGMPSEVSENPPESILRRWRDQLRGQIWRATGFTGKDLFVCKARGAGLI
jgi:uncharacterized SAM-binding protein YcdF (DUF218 family)